MSELPFPRRIAILGSSGSIGRNALEVIAESDGRLEAVLLSVHQRTDILVEQVRQMAIRSVADQVQGRTVPLSLPRWLVVTDENADRTPLDDLPHGIEVLFGHDALCKLVRRSEIDIILSAIVGSAGLTSTWSALEVGKTVALANKESLVMGGSLITDLARENGGHLIPVDSEHSAIMQSLQSWEMEHRNGKNENSSPVFFSKMSDSDSAAFPIPNLKSSIEKMILTASGGPFRTWSHAELAKVTVQDALTHPTWEMGRKITIDSATLMNKALEIIEARWFFEIPVRQIGVVIHPQSVVHSMVEFVDGSTIAQLSPPDMRLPIQLALNYPNRFNGPALRLDWGKTQTLEFYPPDMERFPALALGLEVAEVAGTAGAVINAANETAVNAFLEHRLPFQNIVKACRAVLEHHHFEQKTSLQKLLELDQWARNETELWIKANQ
jgi:1-deoxy-D-xylulose-5-phosphate reductoisomerase